MINFSQINKYLQGLKDSTTPATDLMGGVAGLGASLIPSTDKYGNVRRGGMAASGTLSGVQMGASFGLPGMAVGALAGGIGSLIKGNKLQDEQQAKDRLVQDVEKKNFMEGSRSIISSYPRSGVNVSGFYKYGGDVNGGKGFYRSGGDCGCKHPVRRYRTGGDIFERLFKGEKSEEVSEPPRTNYEGGTLPEVLVTDMPDRIYRQNQAIQAGPKQRKNYSIIDKKDNYIYYFSPKGERIGTEPIITGASNNDVDVSPSMREYFEKTGTSDHEEYFRYLKNSKGQTTPSGIYSISGMRTGTAKNPDKIGSTFNKLFRPEREQEIEDIRIKDYGAQQNLFTLKSEFGVPSSKAIHGTMRDDRVAALEGYDTPRNMSNGCVNVGGNSVCFDKLGEGSGVFILPEESDRILSPSGNRHVGRKINETYTKTRSTIAQELISRGIKPEKEALDFVASVAEKESRGGRSKLAAIENFAPRILVKSKGMFQINPKSDFRRYLPKDYDGSVGADAEAVYNFFNENRGSDTTQMYRKYSGDTKGKYDKAFKSIHDRMSSVYKYGGNINVGGKGFYRNGGDPDKPIPPRRVSIYDPEYPELYKNRQVGSWVDGAYNLPDADEFVVTAPRSYTMKSLHDFTKAALYGAPLGAMKIENIPRAAMTEAIEMMRGNPYDFGNVNPNFGHWDSKQRDLSHTMGYENPTGVLQNAANLGLSVIDPFIVAGVGNAAKNMGRNMVNNAVMRNLPRLESYAAKSDNKIFKEIDAYLQSIAPTTTSKGSVGDDVASKAALADNQLPPLPSEIYLDLSAPSPARSRLSQIWDQRAIVPISQNTPSIREDLLPPVSKFIQDFGSFEEAANNWFKVNRLADDAISSKNFGSRFANLNRRFGLDPNSDLSMGDILTLGDRKAKYLRETLEKVPTVLTDDELKRARTLFLHREDSRRMNPPENLTSGYDPYAIDPPHGYPDTTPLDVLKNQSRMTKEQVITRVKDDKLKSEILAMPDEEFKKTVLKPTGEFSMGVPENEVMLKTHAGRKILADAEPMGLYDYVDDFNSNISELNKLITNKYNKSGTYYEAKRMKPNGDIEFYTPSQSNINGGIQTFSTKINPGKWKGEVQDISNPKYYKAIPGLDMLNTSYGVFPDAIPRGGSGTYAALNEYLKLMNMGRVKPGFNSQTHSSFSAWEKFVKSGRGYGFYGNPLLVYGALKTMLPVGVVGAAVMGSQQDKRNGGNISIPFYRDGGNINVGSELDGYRSTGGNLKPIANGVSIAKGNTHEQGGINLYDKGQSFAEIEDDEVIHGTRVFSDTLKVPKFVFQAYSNSKKPRT